MSKHYDYDYVVEKFKSMVIKELGDIKFLLALKMCKDEGLIDKEEYRELLVDEVLAAAGMKNRG